MRLLIACLVLLLTSGPVRADYRPVLLPNHSAMVSALAIERDGRVLASASRDGTLRAWDAASGRLKWAVAADPDAQVLSFIGGGHQIALGTAHGHLVLFDSATGASRGDRALQDGSFTGLSASTAGDVFATSDQKGNISVWGVGKDLSLRKTWHDPMLGGQQAGKLAMSPDGKWLAGAADDEGVRVWTAGGKLVRKLTLGNAAMACSMVVVSRDGKRIGASFGAAQFAVWSAADGHLLLKYGDAATPSDGRGVTGIDLETTPPTAVMDGILWQGKRRLSGEKSTRAMVASTDAFFLSEDDGSIERRSLSLGSLQWRVQGGLGFPVAAVALLSRQTAVAVGGRSLVTVNLDGRISSQRKLPSLAHDVDVRPHSQDVAIALDGGVLLKGKSLPTPSVVEGVAWSADGSRLAACCVDGTVLVWDDRGTEMERMSVPNGALVRLAWSPDGKRIATAGDDGTLRLWSLAEARAVKDWQPSPGRSLAGLAWSKDGTLLATTCPYAGERLVRLFDADGQPRGTLSTGESMPDVLRFAEGDRRLFVATMDGKVLVCDVAGRRVSEVVPAGDGYVFGLAVSEDGAFVVAGLSGQTGAICLLRRR